MTKKNLCYWHQDVEKLPFKGTMQEDVVAVEAGVIAELVAAEIAILIADDKIIVSLGCKVVGKRCQSQTSIQSSTMLQS